ncbi:FkbM family methyltransferase [Microbulbifer taiwanensis]|uniref:FkbM family methyltransferase n=1 Tax=Microbulbifer taiwanensis TaxID=986746 RepID=UPI0018662F78
MSLLVNHIKSRRIGDGQYRAKSFFVNRLSLDNEHEAWLDVAYKAALESKQGVFVDVGANRGQTLGKLLSFDQNREYIGFEPQLDCCYFISEFIKENRLSTHTLLPVGLSNHSAVLQLLKRSSNVDSTASTIEGFRPADFYTGRQSIYVAKGDDVFSQMDLSDISIVKIDVEGGELEVIEGLQQVLRDHKPFVFFEVLNHFLVVTGQKLDEDTIKFRTGRNQQMENLLREKGYRIFNILPDNKITEIARIEPKVSNDLRITDYVAVHHECFSRFVENYKGKIIAEVTA